LFAEQARNCQKAVDRGFGLELNFHNFTVQDLVESISEILKNQKYFTAIKKYSSIMRSDPMTGREKAAYWIDHVVKFGGKHLRSAAMDMPLYQFLMLDIIAVFIVLFMIILFMTLLLINCTVRGVLRCCSKKNKDVKKVKSQ
jgi:phosphoglucomutase